MRKRVSSKKNLSFQEHLAQVLKLPADLVFQESVITLLGENWIRIVNYQSLLEYQTDKIIIRVSNRKLVILGKNLEIPYYASDEMYITGRVCSINYIG